VRHVRALLFSLGLLLVGPVASAAEVVDPGEETKKPPAGPAPNAGTPDRPVTVGILPSFAFNLDDGIGLGAWGDVRGDALEGEARRHRWNMGLNLKLWLKVRQVGWQIQVGLSTFPDASGDREVQVSVTTLGRPRDWWFGLGMDAARDRRFVQEDDPVPDLRHRFGLYRGRISGHVFQRLAGPLSAFVGGKFSHHAVQVTPDTLLSETVDQHRGTTGGPTFSVDVGLRVDARDARVDPTSGGYLVALAQANLGPGDPWTRLLFDLRGFLPIADAKLVLAAEALVQAALGDVPFYEQSVLAGWDANERSVTGVLGLRAMDRGRLRGPLGALGHVEVRVRPPGFRLFPKLFVRLAPAAWVDVARVDELDRAPVDALPLQPSFGGGVRLFVNEVSSARLDIGTGPERILDADGERTRWTFGIYGNVGHAF